MRWLVLAVIVFGTLLSAVGSMNSHGLAAMGTTLHAGSHVSDGMHGHGHVHGDQGSAWIVNEQGAGTDHPHHETDHSHDKSHAVPVTWRPAAPLLRSWRLQARPWIEMVQASRLERPPMG